MMYEMEERKPESTARVDGGRGPMDCETLEVVEASVLVALAIL